MESINRNSRSLGEKIFQERFPRKNCWLITSHGPLLFENTLREERVCPRREGNRHEDLRQGVVGPAVINSWIRNHGGRGCYTRPFRVIHIHATVSPRCCLRRIIRCLVGRLLISTPAPASKSWTEVTALDSANHRARNRSTGIERGSLIVARRFEATYFTRASPSLPKLSERFYGNSNNFVSLFELSNSRIVELHSIKEKRRELEFGNTTARKEGKKRKWLFYPLVRDLIGIQWAWMEPGPKLRTKAPDGRLQPRSTLE